MKKLVSLALSVLLSLSMSVPAFAANTVTSTESGSNTATQSVKANYTPSSGTDPEITGVSVTIDGTEYTSSNTSADNPAKITPTSTVTLTVTGTNFDKLPEEDGDYMVAYTNGICIAVYEAVGWKISGNTATLLLSTSAFSSCTRAFQILYTNKYNEDDWTDTGIYIIYDSGISDADKAVISGISVKVGGTTYTSGTVTLTPTSGDVTIIVTGTNLKNATNDNMVEYVNLRADVVTTDYGWTVNEAGTEASKVLELRDFASCTTAFEIQYSNDDGTYIDSGVYVIYQAETVSVEVTWGALSFTYSDEAGDDGNDKGWTCDTGANTVKVENKGTVSVKADVTFTKSTSATNITNVTGTFDKSTATLAKDASETFTLTLAGKPDGALSDTEIGTITVTITKASTSAN